MSTATHDRRTPLLHVTTTPCVWIVSCTDSHHPQLSALRDELQLAASIVLLSEHAQLPTPGVAAMIVSPGTKLAKIRTWVRHSAPTGLVCICDPDMTLDRDAASAVVRKAIDTANQGYAVLAYGRIRSDGGSFLRCLTSFDKDWSHRVIRPLLWAIGVGASIPGQFMVVSASLLSELDPSVDSYLDDLYLGLFTRSYPGAVICGESLTVGSEQPRQEWIGLVAQRLRWMKGFMALAWHMRRSPPATIRLVAHFVAYHLIPIVVLTSLLVLCVTHPVLGLAAAGVFAITTSALAGQNPAVGLMYWLTFPLLHVLVTLAWWLPVPSTFLKRR